MVCDIIGTYYSQNTVIFTTKYQNIVIKVFLAGIECFKHVIQHAKLAT